jgi:hypothetical protein
MAQSKNSSILSHAPGAPKGERLSAAVMQKPTRKADDATGINVADRKPISAKMPNLPPA